jgi:hypothetical protein
MKTGPRRGAIKGAVNEQEAFAFLVPESPFGLDAVFGTAKRV